MEDEEDIAFYKEDVILGWLYSVVVMKLQKDKCNIWEDIT